MYLLTSETVLEGGRSYVLCQRRRMTEMAEDEDLHPSARLAVQVSDLSIGVPPRVLNIVPFCRSWLLLKTLLPCFLTQALVYRWSRPSDYPLFDSVYDSIPLDSSHVHE